MADIYLAGKVDSSEGSLTEIAGELEQRGHKITYKWWEGTPLKKPYLNHYSDSAEASQRMEIAVRVNNVFVLFP